ncbi:ribonuclease R [Neolewinella lacunae]|uniref:Ribonuclease R n=1 Tax=Neolewinella lacunae TaxID=1517758 RepID=A0A923PRU8_9BACT|nr:ribonuclease R [Neolewinella lacunae]MBC6995602.1 ribonuclease R [Neolewinella lacunae]MDN3635638.1 ribonuclease R [Neolewinella lacunae]
MSKQKIKGTKLKARDLARAILKELQHDDRKQFNPKQLIRKLKVKNSVDSALAALVQLEADGKVRATDNFKYQLARDFSEKQSSDYAEGRVDLTRTGDAYIVIEGDDNDIFVPARRLSNAQDGDKVKVRYWTPPRRRKPEGEVVEVLERSVTHFVGTLMEYPKYAEVVVEQPGGHKLAVAVHRAEMLGGQKDDKVVVRIDDWTPNRFGQLSGTITAVLGAEGSSEIEMQSILINNGFQITFPEDVVRESEALPANISPQEINIRRDMREVTTFTIDPLTAKDFDDALSIQMLENGQIEVGVHIADVSHYVRPGSALDKEAAARTTSVYLVDRVCPMLPERISNELCSLRPHEDKLTFSAVFTLDPKTHQIRKRWFGRTVTHSDRRFTYEEAQEVLDTGEGDFREELVLLDQIARTLRKKRFKEGSIDFATNEVRFRLAEDGTPLEVYIKERIDTNMLIEDFMLLANREVATFMVEKAESLREVIPFVFRVHDEPDFDKVQELARFAEALGYEMDLRSPQSIAKSYNALLSKAAEDPLVKMLSPIAIRTMAKAVYTTQNIGHYGLAFANYTHFTSPIRRYADVLVHRILFANLEKGSLYKTNPLKLEELCKHISAQERKAVTAERESIKYKQTEFMLDNVGKEFDGVINGLADFGVFVELTENYVEGMISYDDMDEPYDIGAGKLFITGRKSGKKLKMGDSVRVRIEDVDLTRRRIDMALVEVLHAHEHGPAATKPAAKSTPRTKAAAHQHAKPEKGAAAGAKRGGGARRAKAPAATGGRPQRRGPKK